MSDVFISYSRKNSPFARRLIDKLTLAGKDAWVDWEGIPLTSPNWWSEIKAGIDSADNFVFILSPDSMASVVCNMELDYAIELKKRIVPVIYRDVQTRDAFASIADFRPDEAMEERLAGKDPLIIARDNWQRLSHINWVYFRDEDDFDAAFETLVTTVETDLEYVKAHTRYLVRAQEWERENQRADLLLFGGEIDRAEAWLTKAENYASSAETTDDKPAVVNPLPKDLHREYIHVSRQADRRRRRLVLSAQLSIAVLAIVLIAGILLGSSIITQTQQQAADIEATSAQNVALAETQVADANEQLTAVPPTLTQVNQQVLDAQDQANIAATQAADAQESENVAVTAVAERQTTLELVNTQVAIVEATVTQAAIIEEITGSFANILLQQRDNPQAQIAQASRLIDRYPDEALAWQSRGLIYFEQGEYELALADYDRAIQLNPQHVTTLTNRGIVYLSLGEYERAIKDYDRAINLDSENARAFVNRGNAYRNLVEYEQAIEDYDRAIEIDPLNDQFRSQRGVVKIELNDFHGAIIDFDEALRLNPDDDETYFNRGKARSRLYDFVGAIDDYTEAIRLSPEDADTYVERGGMKIELNDFEGAIADFDQALSLNPDDTEAYFNRGLARGRNGDHIGSITDFDEALQLNPDLAMAYFARGQARATMGDLKGAIVDFDEAIRLDSENGDMYLIRGMSYYMLVLEGLSDTPESDIQQALLDWQAVERLGYTLPPFIIDAITEINTDLNATPDS